VGYVVLPGELGNVVQPIGLPDSIWATRNGKDSNLRSY